MAAFWWLAKAGGFAVVVMLLVSGRFRHVDQLVTILTATALGVPLTMVGLAVAAILLDQDVAHALGVPLRVVRWFRREPKRVNG